jgi:hypothetical protein
MRVFTRPVARYVVPLNDDEMKGYHRLRIAETPESLESQGAEA